MTPSAIIFRLCGWIPEVIQFAEVPKTNLWRKLYENHMEGNIIISIGYSEL